MKILHLCLGNYFAEGYGYQENNLVRQHKRMGYDVEVIASIQTFDQYGQVTYTEKPGSYVNSDNVRVTRLPYIKNNKLFHVLKVYRNVYEELKKSHPDLIFIHNFQFLSLKDVVRYLKENPSTVVYVDSHADFSNSARNFISRFLLHRILWKRNAHLIEPFAKKFYGVLPARVDFLTQIYSLPKSKCELLVMGADDDLVEKAKGIDSKRKIREQYKIRDNDFLIISGGKIDQWKTQTLLLMEAVQRISNDSLRLIIFGSVSKEIRDRFMSLVDGHKIQYAGWINSEDSYSYIAASDLAVFPGRHSVLWEQATGQGLPMIVKDWPGTHHIDLGGNVIFLTQDSTDEIQGRIQQLLENPEKYDQMKSIAEKKGMDYFLYKNIAKRAIGLSAPDMA